MHCGADIEIIFGIACNNHVWAPRQKGTWLRDRKPEFKSDLCMPDYICDTRKLNMRGMSALMTIKPHLRYIVHYQICQM